MKKKSEKKETDDKVDMGELKYAVSSEFKKYMENINNNIDDATAKMLSKVFNEYDALSDSCKDQITSLIPINELCDEAKSYIKTIQTIDKNDYSKLVNVSHDLKIEPIINIFVYISSIQILSMKL